MLARGATAERVEMALGMALGMVAATAMVTATEAASPGCTWAGIRKRSGRDSS